MRKLRRSRRPILCPLCLKGRVIDAASNIDISKVKLYGPHQEDKAQFFSKCPKCGEQIGISVG